MRHYETIYIMKPSLPEEDYEATIEKFNGVVEKNQGVMIKLDKWGERSLAYELKKFRKGYYVLLDYCGEAGLTQDLERVFKLDDKVLKFQTVKLSEHADLEALLPKEEKAADTTDESESVESEEPDQKNTETMSDEGEDGVR